jgi:preprotein translocase SecF subunit
MMELISHSIRIDFMGKKPFFLLLSIVAFALAVFTWVKKGDARWGIDFSGGYEFLVQFPVEQAGIEDARVQSFQGSANEFGVRMGGSENSREIRDKVEGALKSAFGDGFSVVKIDYVGPTVGAELQSKALIAVVISVVFILIYIAIRFEFAVGIGSIVALVHDVVISTGIYLALGHTISMAALAAILTIVGYSVNDTVIVFDRVREERNKRRDVTLTTLVNESLNMTLSRTIITHILTFFSALALYLFGGGEIADLSLYLVVGIVCGAYSTIFIVAPVVIWWEQFRGRDVEVVSSKARASAA